MVLHGKTAWTKKALPEQTWCRACILFAMLDFQSYLGPSADMV